MHVPRDLRELVVTVDRAASELERDLGRTPWVDDITTRVGATDEDVLEALHARVEQQAALDHLTTILTPRERRVIVLRFEHELTQAEIAQHVGVSQMQVSRILRRSLDRLRSYLDTHRVADSQHELALQ
jgi:RNA polymerase sigma-B factor